MRLGITEFPMALLDQILCCAPNLALINTAAMLRFDDQCSKPMDFG
jgi:hypothetical protein